MSAASSKLVSIAIVSNAQSQLTMVPAMQASSRTNEAVEDGVWADQNCK